MNKTGWDTCKTCSASRVPMTVYEIYYMHSQYGGSTDNDGAPCECEPCFGGEFKMTDLWY